MRSGENGLDRAQIKQAGLKVTLPRIRILNVLETSDNHHLSAEDVYKALLQSGEQIGLATVYRVLTQFESVGLVRRLTLTTVSRCSSSTVVAITTTWCASSAARSWSSLRRPSRSSKEPLLGNMVSTCKITRWLSTEFAPIVRNSRHSLASALRLDRPIISLAWSRVLGVISRPPNIRATSPTRSSSPKLSMAV